MAALKLDDQKRRQQPITALFTKEEKDQITKAALARGIPPSILVRKAALDVAAKREVASA